jgi:phosphoglycerate dehydrogenase-like enzyme
MAIALSLLLAASAAFAQAQVSEPVGGADQLIAELGLRESAAPVREDPRWRKPRRIVVRAESPTIIASLQPYAPGVEFVGVRNEQEAAAAMRGAQAIIGYCNREIVAAGESLHWVQLFSAGSEGCAAIPALRERRILLTNMRAASGPEIAEHAIAMLLAFTRGLNVYLPAQRSAVWDDQVVPRSQNWELGGRTMLVVGLGGIGSEVAKRAHALGMRVVATRATEQPKPDYVDVVGKPEALLTLAAQADAVVNAAPLTPQTRGLFDARFFAAMKPNAYFINVGRGRSAVTADLVEALRAKRIAGAGLDVMDPEPLPPDHPLWQMPNVIITPHVAGSSDRVFGRVLTIVKENLRRYVAGEKLLSVVDVERGY